MNDLMIDRASILEAEGKRFPPAPVGLEHSFCQGLYARTVHLKAGTLAIGHTHRRESFFTVMSGLLLVAGEEQDRLVGPGFMATTTPGAKRVVYACTDVVVTTFHANPEELRGQEEIMEYYTVNDAVIQGVLE